MPDKAHIDITLNDIADEFREKHLKMSAEIHQMTQTMSSLKYALDSISASMAAIANILDKQASLVLKTFLRSFVALVMCSIVVIIVAIAAITHVNFQGNMQGISVGSQSPHGP